MERKRMIPVVVVVLSSNSGITLLIPLVFILLLVIPHSFIMAQPAPTYSKCINTGNYTRRSQFDRNLQQLLVQTFYNNGSDNNFSNVTEGNDPDKVYGLFLCRGDVGPSICKNCVDVAGVKILRKCPLYKEAIIWYDECLIRYSNRSFFSTMETDPVFFLFNQENATQPDKLYEILEKTFSNLSIVATSNRLNRMYATSSVKLYSMVQCTPDLSPTDCRTCLNFAVSELLGKFNGSEGGRVLTPSCNVRFEFYRFWLNSSESSIMAQEAPTYLKSDCTDSGNYTLGSQFDSNLQQLLVRTFYNKGSDNNFSNGTEGNDPDKVYGLFLCRGDVQPSICKNCVDVAGIKILRNCQLYKEAIIWYDECLVRYSNRSFFSKRETNPTFDMFSSESETQPDKLYEILEKTFSNLSIVATSNPSNHMYATSQTNVISFNELYSMVQCTPDLSPTDCRTCLNVTVSELLGNFNGREGGRVLSPSCNVRFEFYCFWLNSSGTAQPPAPNRTKSDGGGGDSIAVAGGRGNNGGMKGKIITISIITSLSLFLVLTLLGSCIYYQKRRKRTHLQKDDGNSSEVELLDLDGGRFGNNYNSENLQADFPSFQLDIVFAATEHFSEKNKLGEGGFGPVYKGTLPDGREIAVKRLSKTSGQGLKEFKNEVILIARLQHRNLVRLLGCCLEENESLLIYEYMPNKSLDVFIFDSTRGELLDWTRRFVIINGIARGILYLHEDSRLRIIHRDLKASNVLLDHEMNPKISDFGMARIFGGNQNEANTKRIVGSYGYMAPEYAMEGLFSVKSDVFSFGVILLEIISGKKNNGFHLFKHGHSLLTFAWKLWSEARGVELIDPILVQSCVVNEVLKCIRIGLLCVQEDAADRPTMSFVVVMLGSDPITLPQPKQPAISVGRQVLELAKCSQNLDVHSVNEITISDVSPR